jgi:hypothetical protein
MRSSKAQVETRVTAVLRVLLAGGQWWDLCQFQEAEKWNVSESQLRRYMTRALELCAEHHEKDRGKLLARHHQSRHMLYAKCVESGDWRGALNVLKDLAELDHLYPLKLTPLESLLATLPASLANAIRAGLVTGPDGASAPAGLPAGGSGEGSTTGGGVAPGAGSDPPGPGGGAPAGGVPEPGPVAGSRVALDSGPEPLDLQ